MINRKHVFYVFLKYKINFYYDYKRKKDCISLSNTFQSFYCYWRFYLKNYLYKCQVNHKKIKDLYSVRDEKLFSIIYHTGSTKIIFY